MTHKEFSKIDNLNGIGGNFHPATTGVVIHKSGISHFKNFFEENNLKINPNKETYTFYVAIGCIATKTETHLSFSTRTWPTLGIHKSVTINIHRKYIKSFH